ncbi:MAG: glycoside hydrolase, partial [Armatimonadetes bacterium]|nr:glycoside hydrolase [Armatimonadota bacterium]
HIFAHVHPRATVGLIRSRDQGRTWDVGSYTIAFDPGEGTNLNDPSLTTLSDGTIILTVFTTPCPRDVRGWGDKAVPVRGNDYYYVPTERRVLVCRSRDNGYTWEGPFEVPFKMAGVFGAVVELEDSSILMPITARMRDSADEAAMLICSEDQGRTWEYYSTITTWHEGEKGAQTFGLPSVVRYDSNHLLAVGWTVAASGTLVSHSFDGGKTWEPVYPVNTRGSCMQLCLTSKGTTLMSYGYRERPFGIRVLPSYDQGRTWDISKVVALRSDGAMRDLGYPWTIELPNGELFCVYYFNLNESHKPYYDEKAALALCEKWGLDPELYTYRTAGLRFIAATIFLEDEMGELAGTCVGEAAVSTEGPTLL